jgi:hypothetical protein
MEVLRMLAELSAALGWVWGVAVLLQAAASFAEAGASADQRRRKREDPEYQEEGRAARVLFSLLNSLSLMFLVLYAGIAGLLTGQPFVWLAAAVVVLFATVGPTLAGRMTGQEGAPHLAGLAMILSAASLGLTLFVCWPVVATFLQEGTLEAVNGKLVYAPNP